MTTMALQPASLAASAIPYRRKDGRQSCSDLRLGGQKRYLAVVATGVSHERGLGAGFLLLQVVLDCVERAAILECADLLQILALS